MSNSDDYRRDVAGRFHQATRNKTFDLAHRWFPEFAEQVVETADREVEEQGLQGPVIDTILHWFRSDADADWLDRFWQSPEGERFIDLTVEIMTREIFRLTHPELPVPPPGEA